MRNPLYHHHYLSLNRKGCWGTTDDFTSCFLHFFLFFTALLDLTNSRPVHSRMLSSHLYFLPCLHPPFTVLCKMVLARPDERKTCPYQCSLRLFSMVRRLSCGPIACWILAWTSSLVIFFLWAATIQFHFPILDLLAFPVKNNIIIDSFNYISTVPSNAGNQSFKNAFTPSFLCPLTQHHLNRSRRVAWHVFRCTEISYKFMICFMHVKHTVLISGLLKKYCVSVIFVSL